MPEFNAVENTLFIPMLGRIYASEHFKTFCTMKRPCR